jgi:hypothetical protein
MEVAPRRRRNRQTAAKFARVERWAEDSGNAPDGPRTAPDEGARVQRGSAGGPGAAAGLEAAWTSAPARSWTWSAAGLRPRQDGTAAPAAAAWRQGDRRADSDRLKRRRRQRQRWQRQPPKRVRQRRPAAGRSSRPARAQQAARRAGSPAGHADRAAGHRGGLADRPGEPGGHGPVTRGWRATWPPPRGTETTWCVTVTDQRGAPSATAAPGPAQSHTKRRPRPAGSGRGSPASRDGPPGGYGTWRLRVRAAGRTDRRIDTLATPTAAPVPGATTPGSGSGTCPRSGTPHTSPVCRGPPPVRLRAQHAHEGAGGPACVTGARSRQARSRLKQQPGWKVDQLPDGTFRWTAPPDAATTPNPPLPPSATANSVAMMR